MPDSDLDNFNFNSSLPVIIGSYRDRGEEHKLFQLTEKIAEATLSKSTIQVYNNVIRDFSNRIGFDISVATLEQIISYIHSIKDIENNQTYNLRIAGIVSALTILMRFRELEVLRGQKLLKKRPVTHKPEYLPIEEIENRIEIARLRGIQEAEANVQKYKNILQERKEQIKAKTILQREKEILLVKALLESGARISELLQCQKENRIIKGDDVWWKVKRKGNKDGEIRIDLLTYKKINELDSGNFLFYTIKLNPLNRRTALNWVKRVLDIQRGEQKEDTWCHLLRHSCAMYLRKKGMDSYAIKEYLGHQNISTTTIYFTPEIEPEKLPRMTKGD